FFRINNIYLVSLFTIIAIIFFISGIFFGIDFTDTFYHINQAQIPPDGIFVYPILLSNLIIKGLIELFGPGLITLRLINAFLFIFSALLPLILIRPKAPLITKLFYLGCTMFLIAPLNANILGYDTFSIFINSLIFSVTVLYFFKNHNYLLVILALLCSISILIRLPNALVVPILMFLIFYKEKLESNRIHVSQFKLPILFMCLSISGVITGYFIYYETWVIFWNASMGSISHDFKILAYRYIQDALKLIFFIGFITISFYLFKKIKTAFGSVWAYVINLILYISFVILFLVAGYGFALFLTALVLSISLIQLFDKSEKINIPETLILITFSLFIFINAFGSNSGFLKTSFLFLLLPFILCSIPINSSNYWKSILMLLVPFAIFGKLYRTYEDVHIGRLNKTLELELLEPIRTTNTRYDYLNKIDHLINQLEDEKFDVFIYGNNSHIFHYLYPQTTLEIKAFNQPVEDTIFLPHILEKVKDKAKVALFFIDSYPETGEN